MYVSTILTLSQVLNLFAKDKDVPTQFMLSWTRCGFLGLNDFHLYSNAQNPSFILKTTHQLKKRSQKDKGKKTKIKKQSKKKMVLSPDLAEGKKPYGRKNALAEALIAVCTITQLELEANMALHHHHHEGLLSLSGLMLCHADRFNSCVVVEVVLLH